MATKKKSTKKAAKKFEIKRSDIAERLNQIVDTISEIDTTDMSPNDVGVVLSEVQTDLENLADEVTQEADGLGW